MAIMTEEITDDLERQAVYDLDRGRVAERSKESVPLPESYVAIRNSLWIKAADIDPVYRAALEEWEEKEKKFDSRIERKSKESVGLQKEIYSLIGVYSVFQGVLLVAVTQAEPTVLQCRKFWIPVVLSALASLVTFAGILQKHKEIKELKTDIRETFCCRENLKRRKYNLQLSGPNFRFAKFDEGLTPRKIGWSKFAFVWITLVAFAVVFPVFHWVLLCGDWPGLRKTIDRFEMAIIKTKVINRTQFQIGLYKELDGEPWPLQTLQPSGNRDDHFTVEIAPRTSYHMYKLKDPQGDFVKSRSGSRHLDSTFLRENKGKDIAIEYDGGACVWSATPRS